MTEGRVDDKGDGDECAAAAEARDGACCCFHRTHLNGYLFGLLHMHRTSPWSLLGFQNKVEVTLVRYAK